MKTTRCEQKGTFPHPATHVLIWDLLSGRYTRFLCDEHCKNARPNPHHIAKLDDGFDFGKCGEEE